MDNYNISLGNLSNTLKDKIILITGGTGFLGRQLVHRLLQYEPQSIRIFSRDELKHHRMIEDFSSDKKRLRQFIGDIRDKERLLKACEGVDYLIHAAALKRLDLIEYNVEESVKTNVIGTLNVASAALQSEVRTAVFVSTDKACAPINTYGACKFVGERIFTETNFSKGPKRTKLTCVRYGNVLNSTGSVVPFFKRRIIAGKPIPLTAPEMSRFFITANQAVNLILKSIETAIGGEIFIPKLPAYKITDVITVLKKLYGQKKESITKIIGARAGERLHEIMIDRSEVERTYDAGDFFVIKSCIENINPHSKPRYSQNTKLLSKDEMYEYSSENNISDDIATLENLLQNLEQNE